jgi:hypothetical protein
LYVLETGVGNDNAPLKVTVVIPDTGQGFDEILTKLFKILGDYGYGVDIVITSSPTKFIQDLGVGQDKVIMGETGGRKPVRIPPRILVITPFRKS